LSRGSKADNQAIPAAKAFAQRRRHQRDARKARPPCWQVRNSLESVDADAADVAEPFNRKLLLIRFRPGFEELRDFRTVCS
jgi:hypothetical protein